jgi:twitching motility protein PilT
VDGDALVLHAGERPYVVSPTGHSELASRALTLDAMKGMLGELLPADSRSVLEEYGAVEHDLPSGAFPNERFSVIAARGGEDIWIEIRRQRKQPVEEPQVAAAPPEMPVAPPPADMPPAPAQELAPEPPVPEIAPEPSIAAEVAPEAWAQEPEPNQEPVAVEVPVETATEPPAPEPVSPDDEPSIEIVGWAQEATTIATDELPVEEPHATETPVEVPPVQELPKSRVANILPLSRGPLRSSPAPHLPVPSNATGVDRLLRIAAARGASTLYLTSQAQPSIRVDGEIRAIEGEALLSEPEVEDLMLDLIPERNRETLRSRAGSEWICDVPDVGRIRCVTFRDHRGAGGIIRMTPARAISAEQLGLSREIQGLAAEADGIILVTGPRSSGKSTLISALVDLINRTRSDHVITLESQIKFVHENRLSLVSQREVRGGAQESLSAARAALRENPDVLVIEDFESAGIVALAVEASQSGHLVIGAMTAHTATEAIDRLLDQSPADTRSKLQLALSENLRGIVAQVLLRKTTGGRVAAREIMLNTSAVANLIAEGKTSQLPMALEGGRKQGMIGLNDALVALVQNGTVETREAYRRAADRQALLAILKRQGLDTSFAERLA